MRHLLASLLLTTLPGGVSWAQAPGTPPARSGMPNPADDRALAGRVHRLEGRRIFLEGDPEPLYVDHSSVILRHGKASEPSALKVGDEVTASFTFRNGHRVARTLSILSPKPGQVPVRTPPPGRGSSL